MTLHLEPQQLFNDIEAVVDRFTYQGSFQERVKKNFSEQVGIDLPQEILPVLTGRLTMVGAYEQGGETAADHTTLILGVNDEPTAKELLARALKRFEEVSGRKMVSQKIGEVEYFSMGPRNEVEGAARRRRPFSPSVGVFGNALVLGSSEDLFKQMVQSEEGAEPRLRDSLQYKLVGSRLRRLAGGKEIGFLRYDNPEAMLEHWYTMGVSGEATDRLAESTNPVMIALRDALEAGQMPPVEDLLKYAAPGGTIVYDTDTGFHCIAFGFRSSDD